MSDYCIYIAQNFGSLADISSPNQSTKVLSTSNFFLADLLYKETSPPMQNLPNKVLCYMVVVSIQGSIHTIRTYLPLQIQVCRLITKYKHIQMLASN